VEATSASSAAPGAGQLNKIAEFYRKYGGMKQLTSRLLKNWCYK